jgi:putative transposase
MKDRQFTEKQIIEILRQHEAGARMEDLCREHDVSSATLYTWKAAYSGAERSESQRLMQMEDENRRLKQLVADLSLDREALKAVIRKSGRNLPA